MRILIASPFYPPQPGILGTYSKELREAFEKRGDTASVAVFSRFSMLPPLVRHKLYFLRLIPSALRSSVIFALDTWSTGVPAFFAARITGKPFFVRVGGDFLWETYVERTKEPVRLSEFYEKPRRYSLKEKIIFRLTRYIVQRADGLLFSTRFQREIWLTAYECDETRSHILENFFPPHDPKFKPPHNRNFVCAGRHIFLKNMPLFFRAFARVKVDYPDIELDSRPLSVAEHRERVRNSYAVVIPSISEVCSNTAIEAVSLGRPFICTEDTGTKERLNGCGIFVDTRSEDELVRALKEMLDADTYKMYAESARAFAFIHTWDDMVSDIVRIASKVS